MSSLRAFRFQKTKPSTPVSTAGSLTPSTDSQGSSSNGSTSTDAGGGSQIINGPSSFTNTAAASASNGDSDNDVIGGPNSKRARLLSEDEPGTPLPVKPTVSTGNGYGFGGMPSPDVVQSRLDLLQHAFPNKDRMDLQDSLKSCNWSTQEAINKIKGEIHSIHQSNGGAKAKKSSTSSAVKKKTVKAHEAFEMSGSESDEEGEYNDNNKLVYDSESEDDEEISDDEEREERRRQRAADNENDDDQDLDDQPMTDDQRRVFDFFNDGLPQEMACIQGCSKKKVESILELRPFMSWGDLVKKVRVSRQLNTDMLNNTVVLLKMRDGIARLMDKCEKITARMESLVEALISDDGQAAQDLTEQPKSIPEHLKLKQYQMIGLNWLVLMHKQSLNGILADEMGLGKTIQAVSFLAHLKEVGDEGPHLIVVPSSTMDNWQKELALWCPNLKVINYYGSQDERRHMRLQIVHERVDYDVILTTYNMVISSADDRVLFRKLDFHYVIFDEAHMLKNMSTSRYENLMKVQATRKLLLTGTPLQNNLVELMSLLVFVMPEMFANKKEQLKKMFSMFPKSGEDNERSSYEQERIKHAKRIMKPFFLRRLKAEVLTHLPTKTATVETVPMAQVQHNMYFERVSKYKKRAAELAAGKKKFANKKTSEAESGVGMLMNLRKIANHPLLVRHHFDDGQLRTLARTLKRDPSHKDARESYIIEDLSVMSDFDIHKTCLTYRCIEHFSLGNHLICESGKFNLLDDLLPQMKDDGDRVLIFTQFVMVMDIMEQYLRIRGHRFLRLDGSTPVQERQVLIDQYNENPDIFIFVLSTRAGGLGINLTAANTVILHDLDFNPYNDKQAEDRCHRVGQTRPVKVVRLLSEDTIEEGIYSIAQDKLKLEEDLTAETGNEGGNSVDKKQAKKDVKRLLKIALDVDIEDEKVIGDAEKVVYTEL